MRALIDLLTGWSWHPPTLYRDKVYSDGERDYYAAFTYGMFEISHTFPRYGHIRYVRTKQFYGETIYKVYYYPSFSIGFIPSVLRLTARDRHIQKYGPPEGYTGAWNYACDMPVEVPGIEPTKDYT